MEEKIHLNLDDKKIEITNSLETFFENATEIYISVAFIKKYFIDEFLTKFIEKNDKKIIFITSIRNNQTDPFVLKWIVENNYELYIYKEKLMHSKFMIFKNNKETIVTIGSLNLTRSALIGENLELNYVYKDSNDSALEVFNIIKNSKYSTKIDKNNWKSFINNYELQWTNENELNKIKPNKMQSDALEKFDKKVINSDNPWREALITSATGTGKTYLSAFVSKRYIEKMDKNSKILYLVHNRTILNSAMQTFEKVFGENELIKEIKSDDKESIRNNRILFTTEITALNLKEELLKENISFVIFDEVHRLGNNWTKDKKGENKRILDDTDTYEFFKLLKDRYSDEERPFILGMTATPYRYDKGKEEYKDIEDFLRKDIFKKHELIRIPLSLAISEGYVSKFDTYSILEKSESKEIASTLNNAFNKLDEIGTWDGEKVKGIIFSPKKEAKTITDLVNNDGRYKAAFLSGSTKESEITELFNNLQNDSHELNFLVAVDKLNEGVDIPKVNTIIMMRPTESRIIYTQQIGRGLRKVSEKKKLTLIDVVGNHNNDWKSLWSFSVGANETKARNVKNILRNFKDHCYEFFNYKINQIPHYKIMNSLLGKNTDLERIKDFIKDMEINTDFNYSLLDLIDKIDYSPVELRNILLDKAEFDPVKHTPWLVKLNKMITGIEEILEPSEKSFIEKISWMTLSTSSIQDKKELINLFIIGESKLSKLWASYFMGVKYLDEDKIEVNKWHFTKIHDKRFIYSDGVTLKLDKLTKIEKEYLDIVIQIIKSIKEQNDYFNYGNLYSSLEISFMCGFLGRRLPGEIYFSKDFFANKNNEMILKGKIDNTDKIMNYANKIIDEKTIKIAFSNYITKKSLEGENYEYIHCFVYNKKMDFNPHAFIKTGQHMYLGKHRLNWSKEGEKCYQTINLDQGLGEKYLLLQNNYILLKDLSRKCSK